MKDIKDLTENEKYQISIHYKNEFKNTIAALTQSFAQIVIQNDLLAAAFLQDVFNGLLKQAMNKIIDKPDDNEIKMNKSTPTVGSA